MAFKSTKSKDYVSQINNLEKPTYESQYDNLISSSLDKIINKEPFNYDFNADSLYQNYKDQYTKLGKEAAMNAAASVSGLTGGYGNSYGAVAASQANQQYLTQLNDKIPELYEAALQKYQMDVDNNYKQLSALQSEENRQYGIHRDEVSDYYTDWGNLESGYQSALNQENWQKEFEYQKERDAIADEQWQKTYDYNASRAGVSDSQWQKEFDTKNEQWQKEYELALKKAKSSGGSGSGGRSSSSSSKSAGSTLSNKLSPYYEKALEWAENTNAGDIDRVDKYLNQMIDRGLISESEAQKIYNAVMDDNPYFAQIIAAKNK